MNNLVNVPTNGTDNVETYLLLEELDEVEGTYNNLIDIDNANVNCSNNDPSNCPSDALLSDILIDLQQVTLLNSSMLVGTFYDEIMKGIFNCIAERDILPLPTILQVTSMNIVPSDLTHQDTTKTSNKFTINK